MVQAAAPKAPGPVRGTQSFVQTLSESWRHPSWTALEIVWRWVYGLPALALLWVEGRRIVGAATAGSFDPARVGLDARLLADPVGALTSDPMAAVAKIAQAVAAVTPGVEQAALWVAPLLLVWWVVASSIGRTVLLRRVDPALQARIPTLMGLAAFRMVALAGSFLVWYRAMRWSGETTVVGPVAAGQEPNLVGYCALVIVLTLGLFVLWSVVSWWFSVAPLLAMLRGLGVSASLRAAGRIGALKGKLVEVNLVMGIVKIALIVLAMVFSATPLPFESVTTPTFLAWWWLGVTVVYLVASDLFHVVRLVSYLSLWRRLKADLPHQA